MRVGLPIVVLALTVASSAEHRHEDSTPGSTMMGAYAYVLAMDGLRVLLRKVRVVR